MGNEEMFTSPLWQCARCGAWVSHGDDGGAWRWTGTAWEHSGHSDLPPQAGHFPARHFATVADAIAHATATDADRVAALTERVQRLDAVVQAYEAQARAAGRRWCRMSSPGHDELRRWREQGRAPAGSCPFCASRISVVERDGVFVARCSHRGCGARGPKHHDLTRACDLFCCPPQRTAGGMGGIDAGGVL